MEPASRQKSATVKQTVTIYNQLINFFWTILAFAPIGYFCYVALPVNWLYTFLAISLLVFFLPPSFFRAIQLSNTTAIYQKLGLRTVRKYTQNGILVNHLIRRREAAYNTVQTLSVRSHLSKASCQRAVPYGGFCVLPADNGLCANVWLLDLGHRVHDQQPSL